MKKTPSHLPEDYIQREFETYRKAFKAKNEWGLADALTLCKENPSVPLPPWDQEGNGVRGGESVGCHKKGKGGLPRPHRIRLSE